MKKNAFTLIEILISLTIIGLIFAFGYVSFRDFSRRQALTGVTRQVKGDLRLAQENALSGNKPAACTGPLDAYFFTVSSFSNSYALEANCSGYAYLIKLVDMQPGISISSTLRPIIFKVLGQGTNIPGGSQVTITLTQSDTGSTQVVTIDSGGNIQ